MWTGIVAIVVAVAVYVVLGRRISAVKDDVTLRNHATDDALARVMTHVTRLYNGK